jgi:hypothetical protein
MSIFKWIRVMLPAATLAAAGCLGADTVSSDAGRYPELQLTQSTYVLDMPRPSVRVASIDAQRFNYRDFVRFRADTVPPGFVVTFAPEMTSRSGGGAGTVMTVRVTEAATPGPHRISVRASGVVVRSVWTSFIVNVQ